MTTIAEAMKACRNATGKAYLAVTLTVNGTGKGSDSPNWSIYADSETSGEGVTLDLAVEAFLRGRPSVPAQLTMAEIQAEPFLLPPVDPGETDVAFPAKTEADVHNSEMAASM